MKTVKQLNEDFDKILNNEPETLEAKIQRSYDEDLWGNVSLEEVLEAFAAAAPEACSQFLDKCFATIAEWRNK